MARLVIVLMSVGFATASSADITPRRPQVVGSSAVLGSHYTVVLSRVRKQRDGSPQVYLRISRTHRIHGELSIGQNLLIGEPLGIERGVPKRRDKIDARRVYEVMSKDPEVEFDPQATLHSVTQLTEWDCRVCHVAKMPDGTVGCVEMQKRRVTTPVNEVVLLQKDGKKVVLRNFDQSNETEADALCTVHGGRIRARLISIHEREEAKAGLLLEQAEGNWRSKNPAVKRRGQEAYARLLKDFPETSAVAKNRDRIKARAEERLEDSE